MSILDNFKELNLSSDQENAIRKIVGHALHPSREAVGCINAPKIAIENRKVYSPYRLIHHSDRGFNTVPEITRIFSMNKKLPFVSS